jgi:beta-galactosidase/beta-glucuronidase
MLPKLLEQPRLPADAPFLTPSPDGHEYPRPQLRRDEWTSLNGTWDFALDPEGQWISPTEVPWDASIVVPFAPETEASGIGHPGFYLSCWYRRTFVAPPLAAGERLILHFGAVDYCATVWVNGVLAARHEGGYTPFHVDVTGLLTASGEQVLIVRADDDPQDLAKPRGKQDWQLQPHSIWYPRTTGIWQTVWLERVPPTRIGFVRWSANLEQWEIGLELRVDGAKRDGLRVRVKLTADGQLLADDTYGVVSNEVHRRIALSDPGIDDYRNELLWSPQRPTLITAEVELWAGRGERLDVVHSYTALRTVGVQGDRFLLNGRPYQLRLVLDQGYWPTTGVTPPSDLALRKDVELVKDMGFNGVRKHQKIEDPRFLYWADTLGLLVWEEMPSAYRFTSRSIERLTRQWIDVIQRDISHPCVIAWVPFNESWGVPDLPSIAAQRHYVQALYHLTRTLDSSRPVIGNDGWESTATDIITIHDYDHLPDRIRRRYRSDDDLPRILERERPGGRTLVIEGHEHSGQPVMLTEFGGIAYTTDEEEDETWGYSRAATAEEFAKRYRELLGAVNRVVLFSGFCYTQLTDTYQEANGLLYADRTPKIPIAVIKRATTGEGEARTKEVVEPPGRV